MKHYFITGTDTEVGKTYVTAQILAGLAQQNVTTLGYKPIAAGFEQIHGQWVNEDAQALHQASGLEVDINEVNPIQILPPIAPHIGAAQAGIDLSVDAVVKGWHTLAAKQPELLLTEGAGGWRLPLGNGVYLSAAVKELNSPVIIVVGMRLGCLNHAILTAEAVQRDGLTIAGWVANQVDPNMSAYAENLATLQELMPAPMLCEIQYQGQLAEQDARRLKQILI